MRRTRLTLYSALVVGLVAGAALYNALFPVAPRPPAPLTEPIDRILIEKSARRMTVYRDGTALRSYAVRLGFAPEGDKERQGDGRTPEGIFRIDRKNARSRFHLSLGIDYPQREHVVRAAAGGYSPGGDIFIHGQPPGVEGMHWIDRDWTAGCIAVPNAVIEELWRVTAVGTVVEIRP
jgi:murein L,D-transpeptidase YafK